MGGSPKPPKQTDAQAKAEREQLDIQKQQLELAKQQAASVPVVTPNKPIPPAPPPAQQTSVDVANAEQAARQAAMRRTNTARGTLFAAETGGYKAGALGGNKTLLG